VEVLLRRRRPFRFLAVGWRLAQKLGLLPMLMPFVQWLGNEFDHLWSARSNRVYRPQLANLRPWHLSKMIVVNLDGLADISQRLRYNFLAEGPVDEKNRRFRQLRARAHSGWPLRSRCASGHNPPLTHLSILLLCNVRRQSPWEFLSRLKLDARRRCADR
jgi:hypothetical protein